MFADEPTVDKVALKQPPLIFDEFLPVNLLLMPSVGA